MSLKLIISNNILCALLSKIKTDPKNKEKMKQLIIAC